MIAIVRRAAPVLSALALALCACSNDDSSAGTGTGTGTDGGGGGGGGTGDDTSGTFTLSGTGGYAASGGNCSAVATQESDSNDVVQLVVTCTDAPQPEMNLVLDMPYPPAVGSYDLAQTVAAGDEYASADPDATFTASANNGGAQAVQLTLTSVDTSGGATFNDHGNVTATFLMFDGTSTVTMTASF